MAYKNARTTGYILIALGFLLRLAYVQFISPVSHFLFSDMANYLKVAEAIQNGDWRVTHFFQPIGFPYIILALKTLTSDWVASLEWLQIITSTLSLWFFWQTIQKSFGEKIGLISLSIAVVHFSWISFVGLALAENLFILFLNILAWLTLKLVREEKHKDAALWALCFFAAYILKGTHVFYGPLFVLTLFYFYRKKALKNLLIICFIMSAGLIGHGLFTKQKIGTFQMSASAGGLNFVEGKCSIKNNADNAGFSWLSPLYHQLGYNKLKRWDHPFTDSTFFMKEGLKCIQRNPFVMIQSFEGIFFLFFGNTLWPANQTKMASEMRLYELYFGCFCIIGLMVFMRFFKYSSNKKEEILVWLLPVFSVMLCVYIFKSEIRFRIPFDIWIIPLAVKGWCLLFKAEITEPQQL